MAAPIPITTKVEKGLTGRIRFKKGLLGKVAVLVEVDILITVTWPYAKADEVSVDRLWRMAEVSEVNLINYWLGELDSEFRDFFDAKKLGHTGQLRCCIGRINKVYVSSRIFGERRKRFHDGTGYFMDGYFAWRDAKTEDIALLNSYIERIKPTPAEVPTPADFQ